MSARPRRLPAYPLFLFLSGVSGFSLFLFSTIDAYYHVATVGMNPLQLVLIGTTLEIIIFVGEVPTGILADLVSRRLSIIIGHALFGIGLIIEGSLPAFAPIVFANLIWGLGICFISGAEEAWVADELGERMPLQAVFLRGSQWKQAGGLLAIPISILLASAYPGVPIVASGILNLALALFLLLFMPENQFQPARGGARRPLRQFRAGIALIRARQLLLIVALIALFYGLYSEGLDRLSVKHLLDDFALPPIGALPIVVWFGILRAVSSLLSILLAEYTRRRQQRGAGARALWLLTGITATISISILIFANTRWLSLALFTYVWIDALRQLYAPLFFAWLNRHLRSEVRATVISLISQIDAIGQIGGGPGIGYIGLRASTRLAISCSALLLTPAIWLYLRLGQISTRSDADGE